MSGSRKDPGAVAPRPDRVGGQPTPDRRPRDPLDDPALDHQPAQILAGAPRERQAELAPAADRRAPSPQPRPEGEKAGLRPAPAPPPSQPGGLRRSASATCAPCPPAPPGGEQSHRSPAPRRPSGSSSPAAPPDRPTCSAPPADATPAAPPQRARSGRGSAGPSHSDLQRTLGRVPMPRVSGAPQLRAVPCAITGAHELLLSHALAFDSNSLTSDRRFQTARRGSILDGPVRTNAPRDPGARGRLTRVPRVASGCMGSCRCCSDTRLRLSPGPPMPHRR